MYFNEKEITNLGLRYSLAVLVIYNTSMLRHWLSAFNSLLMRSCKLPAIEVLLLVATISFIATLCSALSSGWELALLLLLAIPVKDNCTKVTRGFENCAGSEQERILLSGRLH
ncbi:uncharacterized protein [Rhodnius prolixus]|uniref:uncharacterized protein n=1 Tax=Rhodnius prolixus TaxID=13249 RepID=UPI003D18DAC6